MSPVHLRDLDIPRNQPEEREGLSRTRRLGRGHLGHCGGWKYIEENHTHSAIHFPIQQKPQTRRPEGYGSSSSACHRGSYGSKSGLALRNEKLTWRAPKDIRNNND
ncbi:hypothetical protein O181_097576 [Austropuccinia psidii MF-1]|uniref:Uncharacterized protein n=1 Tax=Austropuccinia psidii MF-1 TaxID=1389203 RepID=A0A9Q3J988_9BASI|nr:hypothetical protein [Austropuccinia psidii MF-1]